MEGKRTIHGVALSTGGRAEAAGGAHPARRGHFGERPLPPRPGQGERGRAAPSAGGRAGGSRLAAPGSAHAERGEVCAAPAAVRAPQRAPAASPRPAPSGQGRVPSSRVRGVTGPPTSRRQARGRPCQGEKKGRRGRKFWSGACPPPAARPAPPRLPSPRAGGRGPRSPDKGPGARARGRASPVQPEGPGRMQRDPARLGPRRRQRLQAGRRGGGRGAGPRHFLRPACQAGTSGRPDAGG